VSDQSATLGDPGAALLALYDEALPQVYGYLVRRCPANAEDLTAETFLAAVSAIERGTADVTIPWLVTVARNKLVDHWRRRARDERKLKAVAASIPQEGVWDEVLLPGKALDVLGTLGSHHQVALTLRYLDGLPVPEVAAHLGRTLHATEALLVRARNAFRRAYGERTNDA
jgi:RNA polymerase sigma-70 factor (ECF subfamily)